jgi:hypothetical protein
MVHIIHKVLLEQISQCTSIRTLFMVSILFVAPYNRHRFARFFVGSVKD